MADNEKTSYVDEKTSVENGVQVVDQLPPSATEYEATPEEKRLVRRLDMRIMPIACIMYLFACKCSSGSSLTLAHATHKDLDRTNLGNARLQGLPEDTLHGDPTGVLFDWVNSAFFFSYVGVIYDCGDIISSFHSTRSYAKSRLPSSPSYSLLASGWDVPPSDGACRLH